MKHEVMIPYAYVYNLSLDLIENMIRSIITLCIKGLVHTRPTIYLKALWEDNYKKASGKKSIYCCVQTSSLGLHIKQVVIVCGFSFLKAKANRGP